MPKIPSKTGVLICHHCQLPIKNEYVRLTHGQQKDSTPDVDIYFCNGDCLAEHFWDERYAERLETEVKKEKNWLYKQVCPACRRRIT
jgi:hypothetical protein